ncbi:TRAP transporter small permease [Sedimentitalea todarodis]|uniref:TRAP transporter small permease protein n=1 Tax=Sedimentitalea todarodis TaxID=1631240 RepID=A0ABU3VH81_9RHOB|nr:TRAP transporter small permease subunit [Sedimentitalea todarodis]MDU9005529.1 TRAP transporter small permease subunit [Sedimentitalea todarodis]
MSAIKKAIHFLAQVPIWLACTSLFLLMLLTFSDVILRSSFDNPIEAATELTRILVAVMVFAVMPHISVTDGHIAVDLTDGFFERYRLSRLRDGLVLILSGGMLSWPVAQVWKLAERTRDYGDVTEYLGLPQYLTMWFIAAGITLAAMAMVIAGVLTLAAPRILREIKS